MPTKRNNQTYVAFWGPPGLHTWLKEKARAAGTSITDEALAILVPLWQADAAKGKKKKAA
jgi:hypothetical protein